MTIRLEPHAPLDAVAGALYENSSRKTRLAAREPVEDREQPRPRRTKRRGKTAPLAAGGDYPIKTSDGVGQGEAGILITAGDMPYGGMIVYNASDTYDPETGTGSFRTLFNTAGELVLHAEEDTYTTSQLYWQTSAGKQSARVATYYHTTNNISWASFQAQGTSSGDVGYAEISGINTYGGSYAAIQVRSTGLAIASLENGSDLSLDNQRLEIIGKTSSGGSQHTVLTLRANPTSAHTGGFGAKMTFYADGSYQGAVYGRFTGAGTPADLHIDAQHSVIFNQGTTPSVTGSRGGNAALASLLSALNTMGLIADNSSA